MTPAARKDDLVIQEVDGETLVYDLKTNKVVSLNKTSALVWKNCDGKKTAAEIAKEIRQNIGIKINEDFVYFAVNQLNKEDLLKPAFDYSDKFAGMSRREVIRKVGVGAMIALPVVAALVAPNAIQAQSCTGIGTMQVPGCPCSQPSDCAPGSCMTPSAMSPTGLICG